MISRRATADREGPVVRTSCSVRCTHKLRSQLGSRLTCDLTSRPELATPAQTFFLCHACYLAVLYLVQVHSISSVNCSIRRGPGITFVPQHCLDQACPGLPTSILLGRRFGDKFADNFPDDKPERDSKFRIGLAKTVKMVPAGYERDECNQTAFPPPTCPELNWK
jgi:hypothetical protein